MARKSQHSFNKRQRELKKAEKAARKRARRAGQEPARDAADGDEQPAVVDVDEPVDATEPIEAEPRESDPAGPNTPAQPPSA